MTAPLSDNALTQIADYLAERIGLHFPPARWRDLQRGIELAAPELGFRSPLDCATWIADSELSRDQLNTLASHLTTSETYFFRDTGLFRHLESDLLPVLIEKRRASGMRLRFWCAGCCTGEEAYTLAIVLHRLIPDLHRWNISLLATDINLPCLAKARAGVYGPWSFRGNTAWNDTRFFIAGPGKSFTVRPELRSFVRFDYLNLAGCDFPSFLNGTSDVDVIICRNVLMYFASPVAREVFGRFSAALAEDGWLVVAPSELSLVRNDLFTAVHYESTILHQKASLRPTEPRVPTTPHARLTPPTAPRPFPNDMPATRKPPERTGKVRSPKAGITADACTTTTPLNGETLRWMARTCADEGRLDEARKLCEQSIVADRMEPLGYYLRALVLQEQGFLAEAADALRQTLYLNPDFIIGHFKLGALAHAIGDTTAARRHWRNTAALLNACGPEAILPESEGLSAARLLEIVDNLVESEPKP
jgi:chemotaxis protein methyltransferase CheR